jgi:hypothetical protein
VQYCVLTRTTRQYGPHPTSDLLGVDYLYVVPADTEFPRRLGPLELFVRFVCDGRFAGRVRVTVTRRHPDGTDRERVYWRVFALPTLQSPGPFVVDRTFKLQNVVVPGEGSYVVRLSRRVRRRWDGARPWRVLGADYLYVGRGP